MSRDTARNSTMMIEADKIVLMFNWSASFDCGPVAVLPIASSLLELYTELLLFTEELNH